jgi:DNA-binding transcriptional MerR regulator
MSHDSEQVFYKLSELSEMLGVETSVLRYWEKEFSQIKPMKVGPRKRLYRRKDFEIFEEIKRLLYEERFTVAGAQKRLRGGSSRQGRLFEDDDLIGAPPPPPDDPETAGEQLRSLRAVLDDTRRSLLQIKDILARTPAKPVKAPAPKKPRAVKARKSKDQDLLRDPNE